MKLVQALESGESKTTDDLAQATGVSRRTVFRDLDTLSKAGVHYEFDFRTQRYSAHKPTLLPPISFSHSEAFALLVAARHAAGAKLGVDDQTAATACLKLESLLPATVRDDLGSLIVGLEIRAAPASETGPILDLLLQLRAALSKERKIRINYDSYFEGKVIDVTLHPRRLAYIHRGWYVIAFTEKVQKVQTYKVERILRLRTLDATYTPDPTFSLDDYFGNAWLMIRDATRYHVKVRFSKLVAANVDEIVWHRTQRTTYGPDGSLLFEVDVDGIGEISWWILGYGDQAEVLEPAELRIRLAERVERMNALYNGEAESSADGA